MTSPRSAVLAAASCLALLVGLGATPASAAEAAGTTVRINAGGPAGTFEGNRYLADSYAVGGWTSWSKDPVSGTTSSALHQARRVAPSGYSIPVRNGSYDVTVKTAETWFTTSGARRFSVWAEGVPMIKDLDVHARVGHDRAYAMKKRVDVSDGRVDLKFSAATNHAVVSAIVVQPVVSTAASTTSADTTPPATSLSGGPGQGTVQTSGSASFSLGADEPATFECRFGGAAFTACPSGYSVSGLPLGVRTLQVRAVDSAGNVDPTPVSRTWTVVSPTPGAVKPGADNTGVPAGTTLKRHEGNLTVTTAGAVVDSLDINGFLVIKAPNVTVRRSVVRGAPITTATAKGLVTVTAAGATNFLIEDSELVAAHPSPWLDGIKGGNFTMRRVEVRGTVDGVGIHLPNTRIESSWVHATTYYAVSPTHRDGSHNDAIQVHGGNNIRIVGNRLEEANNAAIMMTQDYSKTYDVQIGKNWMNHGGCTVNIADKGSTMATISVSGNRFGRSTRNPDCAIISSSLVQLNASGNVWDDNGTAVRIRRG